MGHYLLGFSVVDFTIYIHIDCRQCFTVRSMTLQYTVKPEIKIFSVLGIHGMLAAIKFYVSTVTFKKILTSICH